MIVTKLAVAAGALLFLLLCWLAVAGVAVAAELVITLGALLVLVGGGNWLRGRTATAQRPAAQPPAGRPAGQPRAGQSPAQRPPER